METCRWCGARVSPGDAVCPHCGVRIRRESTTCPRCKSEIRVGLAVCPHCGEELAKRRIPWKLIGSLGGIILAGIVLYALVFVVPLPANLPFVGVPPSPTPTEVILPPTATATETPRPPTVTPTATFTPTITVTATITAVATVTISASPSLTETLTVTPTETPAFRYAAPQLLGPADGEQFSGSGAPIQLRWQPVEMLGDDEWYSIRLSYVDRNGERIDGIVAWAKNKDIPWPVGEDLYDVLGGDRMVNWSNAVVSGVPGAGEEVPVSPPSDTWMFRWE